MCIGLLVSTKSVAQIKKPMKMQSAMTEIWSPPVEVVSPGAAQSDGTISAPSDAIVLFDGKDLSAWVNEDGEMAEWIVHDGVFTVNKGTGDILTKQSFEDFQLHIEWQVPKENLRGKSSSWKQRHFSPKSI